MPRKTMTKKKVYKKRTYKRRPKTTLSKTTINAGLGFPKKMVMSHKYFEIVTLQADTGVLKTYNFSANSMYDPNVTGTGHQPMYFDQMSTIYDHWVVIGSKINVTVSNLLTTNTTSTVGVYLNDDATVTPVTLYSFVEHSKSQHKQLAAGTNNNVRFSLNYSAKKTYGKSLLANNSLQGTISSNPSETINYTLFVQPTDQISNQYYVVEFDIKYIAVWSELKDINSS